MKVLLTGGTGQLGLAMAATAPRHVQLIVPPRTELDLLAPETIVQAVARHAPDIVVNAAAYTAVDRAETDSEAAYAVNSAAVGALSRECARGGVALVHVSTDFVFDGSSGVPYEPGDPPAPLNVYGASKLGGEKAVESTPGLRWLILRTAWVYSPWGRNFLGTMLRLLRERRQVSVVADQVGTPTSAHSLAAAVWRACEDRGPPDRLHVTDAGVASWYDFAVAIAEEATAAGLLERGWTVRPIPTSSYPTPARRPPFSVLAKDRSWARLGIEPVHWREALRQTIGRLER